MCLDKCVQESVYVNVYYICIYTRTSSFYQSVYHTHTHIHIQMLKYLPSLKSDLFNKPCAVICLTPAPIAVAFGFWKNHDFRNRTTLITWKTHATQSSYSCSFPIFDRLSG